MAHCEDYIDALINKDDEAFTLIYEETKKAVFALIVAIVANRAIAEDLMQDTYMTMIEKIHQYQRGRSFLAWLLVIARNKAIDYLRENKKVIYLDQEEIEYVGQEVLPIGEKSAMVNDMLSLLTNLERQIFLLHISNNVTFKEIAVIINLSLGTVLWHYSKAVKKIKQYKEEK